MTKPYLGVWLDHRDAYLVWADDQGDTEVQHLRSAYEDQKKKGGMVVGGGSAYGGVPPHAGLEDKRRQQTHRFHEKLAKLTRSANQVYIFGPGQARKELAKVLRSHKDIRDRVAAVESADRMTQPQITAHVRDFWGLPNSPRDRIPRVA